MSPTIEKINLHLTLYITLPLITQLVTFEWKNETTGAVKDNQQHCTKHTSLVVPMMKSCKRVICL